MFSCRSRFEPSGVFESFTCRQRRRSRPISRSSCPTRLSTHGRLGDVVAGRKQVTRVEADAEPLVAAGRVVDRGQLFQRAPDRVPGSRRVLHAEPRRLVGALERLGQRGHDALEAGLEAGAEVRADVEDDRLGADRGGGVDGRAQRGDALLVEVVLRAGEVQQVERVDRDGADPELLAPGAEGLEVGRVVLGEAPRARALGEQLHRVHPERVRVLERLLDPARAVAAEEHAADATRATLRGAAPRPRARVGSQRGSGSKGSVTTRRFSTRQTPAT